MAEEKKTSTKAEKPAEKKSDKPKSKNNPLKSIAKFFKGIKSEVKKVVWPTAKDVVRNTLIVILVVAVVGVAIYGVDTLLTLGIKGIKNLSENTTASTTTDAQTTAEALDEATEDEHDHDHAEDAE